MLGFINLYKQSGMSSAFAVSKVKRLVKEKCGHMGTLDPLASGILPIGVNQASRLFQYMLNKKKVYDAVFDFSYATDTLDSEGEKTLVAKYIPTEIQIKGVLQNFVGKILQVPPKYSAKSINGQRSYKLARAGVEFELEAKTVEITNFELIKQVSESAFEFKIECFGGTYIRSLARDLGLCFSCPATMTKLERTTCGFFDVKNSITIEELINTDDFNKLLISPDKVLNFTSLKIDKEREKRLLNGLFDKIDMSDGLYNLYSESDYLGVGEVENGILKVKTYVRNLDNK